MFARFDENPAMTLRVIKETKRYGRMDARTDNVKTVYTLQTKFAGGIKTQHIGPAIPHPAAQGLSAVITNDWYIIYTEILKLQHQASNFGFLTSCKNSEWLIFTLAKDAGQLAFSLKKLELSLVTLQIRKFN